MNGPSAVGPLVMLASAVRTLTAEIASLTGETRTLRASIDRLGARIAILTLEHGDRHRMTRDLDQRLADEITQKINDSLRREITP